MPSLTSSLLRGLGLPRKQVPQAVAHLVEGGAQGPGQRIIGL